ncbi:MAG: biotin/lipoyl-containing protein [Magnetospiraceae bacterium]
MKRFKITVDGTAYDVTVEDLDEGTGAAPMPAAPAVYRPAPSAAPAAAPSPAPAPVAAGAGDVVSPLSGMVNSVEVKEGDTVTNGQTVLKLEAMKMISAVVAPQDGTVTKISVAAGDSVQEGQPLLTIG